MPRRLLVVPLLVVLSALAVLAGCGGGTDVADKSATQVLRETFGPDRSVGSGRMDLSLSLSGLQSSPEPVELSLRGPFAGSRGGQPRFDLDASVQARGVGITAGAISTGERGYLTVGTQTFVLDDSTYAEFRRAYETEPQSDGRTLGALGVDPLRWLRDPKKAGSETVAGARTVHVTADVDVPRLLSDVSGLLGRVGSQAAGASGRDVPTQLTAAQRAAITAAVRSATIDVFTGADDGLLRRVAVRVDYDVPQAAREAAGGLTAGTISFGLTLAELNVKQSFPEPKGARPISELSQALALAGGGAAGTP